MSEFDPRQSVQPGDDDVWLIEGVSDSAIAWAEGEAARRSLTLAEWVEEAIERALVAEKAARGDTGSDPAV